VGPFVLVRHFWPACEAALLFGLGSLLAWPAVRFGPGILTRFPHGVFRLVLRLFGENPGMMKMWGIIFGFNSMAMFLYMASGFRPWLPEAFAVLTGFNLSAVMLQGEEGMDVSGEGRAPGSLWIPGRALTAVCAVTVLLLELPCFWFSIGMGLTLGREILAGSVEYGPGLALRAHAYSRVVLPLLLASAVCEGVAIRGMRMRG
jgi:hypothetical protein